MVGEILTETWFGSIWKNSRKGISWEPERRILGILSFEVSRLMSKVVNLWQSVTDRQILKLREEFANSVGIQKLVSEDEDYLMDLALAEIIDDLGSAGKFIAMLGKKCVDPIYHNLESIFDDPSEVDPKWYGWRYRLKKMDRRVKKMERFVAVTEQLYSELEVLEELEQGLRLMQAGANVGKLKLLEFQQKVYFQRQEVKNLREMSPWIRTYDYTVRLLLRSLFTILERIKYVYGVNRVGSDDRSPDFDIIHCDYLTRCTSMPGLMQPFGYPSENTASRCPVGRSLSKSPSSTLCLKSHPTIGKRFAAVGLTGCMGAGMDSPFVDTCTSSCGSSFRSNVASQREADEIDDMCTSPIVESSRKTSFLNSKRRLLNAPSSTLGYAALALHYANIIILIEKLASSPELISLDARDDLYNMLPSNIRRCMKAKLKTIQTALALSDEYHATFAAEWRLAVVRILEWLSPLAHNMLRWQSERNFERQRVVLGMNVLLVQTLYFADQEETEAAIVQLLLGLNFLFRFGRTLRREPSDNLHSMRWFNS